MQVGNRDGGLVQFGSYVGYTAPVVGRGVV